MAVTWADSADRHGVPHEDALYAIAHATGTEDVEGRPGWTTTVYVGRPHGQTDRYIEVIVATRLPREVLVFHVMELSDLYRHLAD